MIFHHTSLVGLLGGLDSRDRSLLQRSSKCASEAWKNWFLAALAKNQSTHRDRVLFWMGWSIKTDIFVYKDWMLHDHILGLHEIPSRSRCSKTPRPITDPYPAMVNDLTGFFHQILAHRESPGHMMDLHVDACWKEVFGVLTQGSTRSDLYKFRLTLDTWWVLLDSPATAFLQNLYVDFCGWKKKVTRSFFLLANWYIYLSTCMWHKVIYLQILVDIFTEWKGESVNDEIVFFRWELGGPRCWNLFGEVSFGGPCDGRGADMDGRLISHDAWCYELPEFLLEVAEVMFSSYVLRRDWPVMYCDVPRQDSHQAGLPTPGRERGEQRAEEIEDLKVKNSIDCVLLVDLMAWARTEKLQWFLLKIRGMSLPRHGMHWTTQDKESNVLGWTCATFISGLKCKDKSRLVLWKCQEQNAIDPQNDDACCAAEHGSGVHCHPSHCSRRLGQCGHHHAGQRHENWYGAIAYN